MLRLGIISELGSGGNAGFARVSFDDRGFVSGWLQLPSSNTANTKHWTPIAVKTQVACLMDDACEQGCIVMALWSSVDTPPGWASPDTFGIMFSDSTEIFYDTATHTLSVNAPSAELNFKCNKLNIIGDVEVTGEITATKEVTAGELKIKLTTHKHPTSTGISGAPTP